MTILSEAQRRARKAKASRKKNAAEKAQHERKLARVQGELAAYKKLMKDGWRPKGVD